jgi:hypothetical protein
MSRPVDINLTNSSIPAPSSTELEEFAQRMIQVLDRGHIIDRFKVEGAPTDIHYEWHKDDPLTHARLTAKGFVTDDDLAKRSGFVHTDGAGNPRIADVRLYKIHKSKYDILQKIEEERVRRVQDPRRADKDFMQTLRNEGGFDEVVGNSTVESVKGLQVSLTPNKKE